jgi:phage anti-repressor protein
LRTVNWIRDDNPNDSIWTNNGNTFPNGTDGLISTNSTYQVAVGLEKCWEYYYQNGYSEYYFIFNHDIVQSIGWQAISGTNRGLLKRVKVNMDYLKNYNFTITYP